MLLTVEQGKPLAESRVEVGSSASYVLWFAEEARRIYGDTIPSPWPDRRIVVMKQPVGVVGAITPWNFPSSMIARKLGPALATGCTIVIKPASQTPYSGLAWGALCEKACEWGAIRKRQILKAECVRCDDCEILYDDRDRCPHWLLELKRKTRAALTPGASSQ